MKNIIFYLLLLSGCSQAGNFSGVYVKHVKSEYSVGDDTVYISHADGHYIMDRRTGFCRLSHGERGAKELKLQHAVLEVAGDGRWQDAKTGVIITQKNGKLLLGTAEYEKIK